MSARSKPVRDPRPAGHQAKAKLPDRVRAGCHEQRRPREGTHYRPRAGSVAAQHLIDRDERRSARFAARDAEYRAALGIDADAELPAMIGRAELHSRPSEAGWVQRRGAALRTVSLRRCALI